MLTAPRRRLVTSLLVLGVSPAPLLAQANWDALPNGSFLSTPNPYVAHNYFYGDAAFGTGNALQYSTLNTDCRSGPNCAYNANGTNAIRIEALTTTAADAFTFSGYFAGGYPGFGGGPASVLAQGFVGSSVVPAFSLLFAIPADGSFTLVDLTAMNVNRLLFSPALANGSLTTGYLRLDDVTFGRAADTPPSTTTPEPASVALLASGLLAIGGMARRRRPTGSPTA